MKEISRFLPFLPEFSSFFPIFPDFPDFWQFFCCQRWHSAPIATPVATPLENTDLKKSKMPNVKKYFNRKSVEVQP